MEKAKRKTDRRVLRTKRNIHNAFLQLLAGKDFEKITVKEIAMLADVDRKTVYNYYTSTQDILEELGGELVKDFESALAKMEFDTLDDGVKAFEIFTELLESNLEVYGLLMKMEVESNFMGKIKRYFKAKVRGILKNSELPADKLEMLTEYTTAGLFMAYRYWFNAPRKLPLGEFSKELRYLIVYGLGAYVQEKIPH